MACSLDATVVATTRTSAKRAALLDAGADHVVVTNEESITERVHEVTEGVGADVAFDAVAGPEFGDLVAAMAPSGTIVLYGGLAGVSVPLPVLPMIGKGLTVRGYTFKETVSDRVRRDRAVDFILEHVEAGRLRPIVYAVLSFAELDEAHRLLEGGQQFGKIVVDLDAAP